jgi:hypothetical protein
MSSSKIYDFKPGESVIIMYPGSKRGVGWVLTEAACENVNHGKCPCDGIRPVIPWKTRNKIHYYSSCSGRRITTLARTIQDTTCMHCLMTRTKELRGWRWTDDHNAEEVQYLINKLGDRVKDFDKE